MQLRYAVAQMERDNIDRLNEIRTYMLRGLLVLEPDRAQRLMNLWEEIKDVTEVDEMVRRVRERVKQVRSLPEGTAGRDEEAARILRERRADSGRLDSIETSEELYETPDKGASDDAG